EHHSGLSQRRRPGRPHDVRHVPAGPSLRGRDGGADRRRGQLRLRLHPRRGAAVRPVLLLVEDRPLLHARQGGEPAEAPQLHGIVDRLCALADMPKPRVAIADTDVPNAFATGRNPGDAVVCATTGILRRLEPAELEAVLAHELSHVAHRDVAVMTIAGFLGVAAGFITRSMFWFGGAGIGGGRGRGRDEENEMLLIMLVSVVVYAISFLLTRA